MNVKPVAQPADWLIALLTLGALSVKRADLVSDELKPP
jgi:hypothetical protein